MNHRLSEPARASSGEDPGRLRTELVELSDRDADLARGLDAVLASERLDADGFARLVACRSSIADRRIALLARWILQVEGRVRRIEARLGQLSGEVEGHEEALKMLCEVMKEFDDPYGFGLSLDERIAGESSNGPGDGPED